MFSYESKYTTTVPKLHIIVGGNGQGKSTLVRKILDGVPNKDLILLLDVQKDKVFEGLPKFWTRDIDEFKKEVLISQDRIIVFEEASIFFGNRGYDRELVKAMIDRRHRGEVGNYIIMVFHSLRKVPLYIADIADYITILKTNDSIKLVEEKFQNEEITQAFEEVQNGPKFSAKTVRLYG